MIEPSISYQSYLLTETRVFFVNKQFWQNKQVLMISINSGRMFRSSINWCLTSKNIAAIKQYTLFPILCQKSTCQTRNTLKIPSKNINCQCYQLNEKTAQKKNRTFCGLHSEQCCNYSHHMRISNVNNVENFNCANKHHALCRIITTTAPWTWQFW